MRNLKRALSLALASVMLMGMMVVGSSAASYPDVDSNDNTEAIAVLNAVEVMIGNENGEFEPDKNVTRNEMAVILAKLILGKDADKYVGTCPFTDVPEWAQKYVAACYDNKIVAGRTESLYDGSAVVTAQEAAAMVLRVLGYEKLESTGTNWAQPVVAKANELRLFADVGSSASAPLNRNQVAQLSLNALQTTMVTSDVEKDIIIDGVVTIPGKVTYTERTTNKFDYTQSNGVYKKDVSDEKLQLCENLYEKDLLMVAGKDAFGRPASIWSYKADEVVTVADSADASYVKAVKAEDLYKDLGLKEKTTASVMVDGKDAPDFSITKTGSDKIGGNGVVVDAYKDDEGKVTISVINSYVGEISKVTEAKDGDPRTVSVGGMKFETEGFDVDDVVVYTKADGKIKTMYLAEIVEDVEITKTVGDPVSEFVADDATYKFAANWTNDSAADLVANKENVKKENKVDLYLDSNGYVVKVALNEGTTAYAYVIEIGEDSSRFGNGTPFAKLLLTDGTVLEAELKYGDYSQKNKDALNGAYAGRIVEYSKNSKDVYKLEIMKNGDDDAEKVGLVSGQKITVDAGKPKVTLGTKIVYADSETIFLTDDGNDNYKAYVGYDEVPSLVGEYNADANAIYAYYCESGSVAKVIYVRNATTSSNDIVFLLGTKCGEEVKVKDGDNYFVCPAVVNGEIEDVKLDAKIGEIKLFKSITWANEDEEIISVSKSTNYSNKPQDDNHYIEGVVSKALSNKNIMVNGVGYGVDGAKVFVYDSEIGDSTAGSISKGDAVMLVINDGKVVTIFYKESKADDGDGSDTETEIPGLTVDSSNWNANATSEESAIVIDTVEIKGGTEITIDDVEAAIIAKVKEKKPAWMLKTSSESNGDYVLTFENGAGGALRYVKVALSLVGEPTKVAGVTDPKDLATALTENDKVILDVDAALSTGVPADTTLTISKGKTLDLTGGAVEGVVTGEGAVDVKGAVTKAENLQVPAVTLSTGGSLTASSAEKPVGRYVEGGITVTVEGGTIGNNTEVWGAIVVAEDLDLSSASGVIAQEVQVLNGKTLIWDMTSSKANFNVVKLEKGAGWKMTIGEVTLDMKAQNDIYIRNDAEKGVAVNGIIVKDVTASGGTKYDNSIVGALQYCNGTGLLK